MASWKKELAKRAVERLIEEGPWGKGWTSNIQPSRHAEGIPPQQYRYFGDYLQAASLSARKEPDVLDGVACLLKVQHYTLLGQLVYLRERDESSNAIDCAVRAASRYRQLVTVVERFIEDSERELASLLRERIEEEAGDLVHFAQEADERALRAADRARRNIE